MRQLFKQKAFAAIFGFILLMGTLACTCSTLPFLDEEAPEDVAETETDGEGSESTATEPRLNLSQSRQRVMARSSRSVMQSPGLRWNIPATGTWSRILASNCTAMLPWKMLNRLAMAPASSSSVVSRLMRRPLTPSPASRKTTMILRM